MTFKRLAKEIAGAFFKTFFSSVTIRNKLIILAYHRVLDFSVNDYPFDEEVISAFSRQFEEQIRCVAARFTPLTFRDVKYFLENGKQLPRNSIVVTFDDGYFDNYKICYPILRKYGIPAVFFVSTDYIGTKKVFWFERLVYQLKKTDLVEIDIKSLGMDRLTLNENKRESINKLLSMLKKVPDETRRAALLELDEKTGIEVEDCDFPLVRSMTWDELNILSENGMEVGSHTKSHPILSTCRDELIFEELVESKSIIEKKLGISVISVSYPVGGARSFNDKVKKASRDAGYYWGISYVQGINYYPITDRFSLKRLHIETDVNVRSLSFNLARYIVGLG